MVNPDVDGYVNTLIRGRQPFFYCGPV